MNKDGGLKGADINPGEIEHPVFVKNHKGRNRFKLFMMEERGAGAGYHDCQEVERSRHRGNIFLKNLLRAFAL